MTQRIKQLAESRPFHHFIVAVIVLAGVVAGLETSPALIERHGTLLLAFDRLILAIYFVTFIVFGTMIIMNLFIGIIMSSMSEMHEEMAVRDRAQHIEETGSITLGDELRALERQTEALQGQLRSLRHRAAHAT